MGRATLKTNVCGNITSIIEGLLKSKKGGLL